MFNAHVHDNNDRKPYDPEEQNSRRKGTCLLGISSTGQNESDTKILGARRRGQDCKSLSRPVADFQ